ncbi:hypothetical protein E8E12_001208 [Didymella heteroderae]|uniref:Uncharacterized protein n=1 Tax=Didymella heteroderae TaxID=1769908 RepID=A0A9P4WFW8_9PLEO|nr:hypothetical protein E8E12_001208 [Didymella heteroderae]
MKKLDRCTVKAIELTSPGACREDAATLVGKVRKGEILEAFDCREREEIWERILAASTDRLIPSLTSFFADLTYLQGPAECIKRLIGSPDIDRERVTLKTRFTDVNQKTDSCIIQVSENSFLRRPGSAAERLDLGYRVVWLSAMRHYPDVLPQWMRGGENHLAKAACTGNDAVLRELAILAYQQGFESAPIRDLVQRSPEREVAKAALLAARDPKWFRYEPEVFERCVETMIDLFNTASKKSEERVHAASQESCRSKPPKRCGIPKTQDHRRDQALLFVDQMHSQDIGKAGITSFFIRRSVYLAFFGRPRHAGDTSSANAQTQEYEVREEAVDRDIRAETEKEEEGERYGYTAQAEGEQQPWPKRGADQAEREEKARRQEEARLQEEAEQAEEQARLREATEQAEREERARLQEEARLREATEQAEREERARRQEEAEQAEKQARLKEAAEQKVELERNSPSIYSTKFGNDGGADLEQRGNTSRQSTRTKRRITQINMARIQDSGNSTLPLPKTSAQQRQPTQETDAGDLNYSQETADPPTLGSGDPLQVEQTDLSCAGKNSTAASPMTVEQTDASSRRIDFMVQREDNRWHIDRSVSPDPNDPQKARRAALKYRRKADPMVLFNEQERELSIDTFATDVVEDNTFTVFLLPRSSLGRMTGNDDRTTLVQTSKKSRTGVGGIRGPTTK